MATIEKTLAKEAVRLKRIAKAMVESNEIIKGKRKGKSAFALLKEI